MWVAKPMPTPMCSSTRLTYLGEAFLDPAKYKGAVGALQYLAITRAGISYVINKVSQFFMQSPFLAH